jgi:hypothetical protein
MITLSRLHLWQNQPARGTSRWWKWPLKLDKETSTPTNRPRGYYFIICMIMQLGIHRGESTKQKCFGEHDSFWVHYPSLPSRPPCHPFSTIMNLQGRAYTSEHTLYLESSLGTETAANRIAGSLNTPPIHNNNNDVYWLLRLRFAIVLRRTL